ncbi:MAG: discoidin domain-containing protein, partial [Clostridiales bacterium]|nr:discoidin domain-containing protein [Clostridiales bacterium]
LKVAPEQPSVGHYGVIFHGSYVGGSGLFPYESGIPASERRAGAAYSTNIVVRNNYFQDVGNAVICFGAVENAVAEYNISDHCNSGLNGNVPIWWHDTKHVVAQYNEIFDSGASTSKEDSQAFDADINAKYNIVQYNYTHDNPSGSFFECDSGTEYVSHFRYNVSVNDGNGNNSHGNGAVVTLQSSGNQNSKMYIYNNDFYIGEGKTSLIGNHWGGTNAHKPHYMINNFIYDNGLGNGTSSNSGISGTPGIAYESRFFNSTNFDNNYYGGARAEKIVASTDKNPVTGGDVAIANLDANIARDLAGLTGWEKLQDFTRGAASVLKGSGAALPQLGEANSINDFTPNGGLDIMGNPVSPFHKPSIGAYEVGADLSVPEDKKVIDFETAVSDVALTGANWRTADNGNFGKELYWNTAATDARQAEIVIPAGYTFYGFTARTANSAKITVDFNGQSKTFYATSAKNSFMTDFTALPVQDTPVRISIASPWGVNGVFLDNLIISNTPPKTNDVDKGENILPGKAVTQSGGSEAAANGNDNDIATVAGKSTLDGGNYTWQADLGQTHDLNFAEVEWPADFGANDWKYKIEYSMDSVNWGVLADYTQSNPNTALLQERALDHLNARYLRLTITGLPSGQTGEAYFGEFRAYGKPIGAAVENLALNKPSTVSAGYNPAKSGNDGDKTTFSGNNGSPVTWTVDLEDLYNVTQIVVSHEPGRNDDIILDWKYVLEYSEDGSTWAEVPFVSSNGSQTVKPATANYSTAANNPWSSGVSPADSVMQATGTDVNARYLRMRFTGKPTQPTDFWYVLYEFEVFGGEINAAAENVALKKAATVSPGSNAQYGNDGSKDSPFAGNNGNPVTWTVNLDGLYDISKIGVYHEPKRAAAEVLDWKYVLEYSVDGSSWSAVPFLSSNGNPEITPATATYNTAANHPWASGVAGADSVAQITNTAVAARHLRIRFTGKPSVSTMSGAWYGLWEFEA